MMKVVLTFVFIMSLSFTMLLYAQPYNNPSNFDSAEREDIASKLDNLLSVWHGSKCSDTGYYYVNKYSFEPDYVPVYPDSVIIQRLKALNSPIPLVYNIHVKNFIDVYLVQKRKSVSAMIGLSHYYFPIFEEELDKNGMPLELKYLAIIESALNTYAVSRVGATGIWQFMYQTGKLYGLTITSYVDERRDPYEATKAAVAYLKEMYGIYHDWLLVIASYNCGAGNVNRAIRRSGNKTNFWDIYPYLPSETRGYVPAFIAANYVMNYYREHNVYPYQICYPGMIDTLYSDRNLSFNVISRALNIPIEKIRLYNPQYHRDILPKSTSSLKFALRLPLSDISAFESNRQLVFAYQDTLDNAYNERYSIESSGQNNSYSSGNQQYKLYYYKVKYGDNLGIIASLYDCDIYDIKRWNNLRGYSLNAGKVLKIYVSAEEAANYKNINSLTYQQKVNRLNYKGATSQQNKPKTKVPDNKTSDTVKNSENNQVQNKPNTENVNTQNEQTKTNSNNYNTSSTIKYSFYTIKSGDTLWSISQRFPGNSPNDLMAINNLAGSRSIKPGQKIKVKILE